jgi:hypothetical protein
MHRQQNVKNICLLNFFWLIPRRLNFMCRRFGTLCSILIGRVKKKKNWEEIARVFLQVKAWLKRNLGQSEGEGTGEEAQSGGL